MKTDEASASVTIYMHNENLFNQSQTHDIMCHFLLISASELDLNSTFYIRLSYMPQDFKKNDLKYHQNWFSNKHDIKENKIQYGILDSYHDGAWKIQRENNYTYYTGEDGFSVPFVCEHQPLDVK